MELILIKLLSLYGTLRNLHYAAKGVSFYSIHKMADDLSDGLLNYIDEIQENYYLSKGLDSYDWGKITQSSSEYIYNGQVGECLRGALVLIEEITNLITELKVEEVENIFSNLSQYLFKAKGFILRTI